MRSRGCQLLVAVLIVVILGFGATGMAAGEETEITHCYGDDHPDSATAHIDEPGNYVLVNDIEAADEDYCLRVEATDVTLDGQNFSISGTTLEGQSAIVTNAENTTIKNTDISNFENGYGIVSVGDSPSAGNEGQYSGIDIEETGIGIHLDGSDGGTSDGAERNVLEEIRLNNIGQYGIVVEGESDDNAFADIDVRNATQGLTVLRSSNNSFTRIDLQSNDQYGIFIEGYDPDHPRHSMVGFNSFENITADGNEWAVRNLWSQEETFDRLNVGASIKIDTQISLTLGDHKIGYTHDPPEFNERQIPLGRYFEAESTGTTSDSDIQLHYDKSDVRLIDEEAVSLYSHTDQWSEVGDSSVDTDGQVISTTLSSVGPAIFGAFGPFNQTFGSIGTGEGPTGTPIDSETVIESSGTYHLTSDVDSVGFNRSDITLNLNGYSVNSLIVASEETLQNETEDRVIENIEILNGKIDTGIFVAEKVSNYHVHNMYANDTLFSSTYTQGGVINNSHIEHGEAWVGNSTDWELSQNVFNSSRLVTGNNSNVNVERNAFVNGGSPLGNAILLTNNNTNISINMNLISGEGIRIADYSNNSLIQKNTLLGGYIELFTPDADPVVDTTDNVITNNSLSHSFISVEGHNGTLIDDNVLTHPTSYSGISLEKTNHSVVSENNIAQANVGIQVNDSNNTVLDYSTIIEAEEGIEVQTSNNSQLSNIQIAEAGEAIRLQKSNRSELTTVAVSNSDVGLQLEQSHNNYLSNGIFEDVDTAGLFVYGSTRNNLTNSTIEASEDTGIFLEMASDNYISNMSINNSDSVGVFALNSTANNISNSSMVSNDVGVFLEETEENQVHSTYIEDFDVAAFLDTSTDDVFSEISLLGSGLTDTTISFEGDGLGILGTGQSMPMPSGHAGIGHFFDVFAHDEENAHLDVSVHYEDEAVPLEVDHDDLQFLHLDEAWSELPSEVDQTERTVSTAVSDFSTFGVFYPEPEPYFGVEILETNTPVEGETLEVDVRIENTGDGEDVQDIVLETPDHEDSNFPPGQWDERELDLNAGQAETLTLEWDTEVGYAGEGFVVVHSDNDTDSGGALVLGEDQPYFTVDITDITSPAPAGEQVQVTATVTNIGDSSDTQDVLLRTPDHEDSDFPEGTWDAQELTLDSEQSETVTLGWETDESHAGDGFVMVQSEDEADFTELTLLGDDQPYFDPEIVETNAPIEAGETLEATVPVANIGTGEDTQTVLFAASDDGEFDEEDIRDSQEQQLDADEEVELTFEWETQSGNEGTWTLLATTDNASDTTEIEIEEATTTPPPGESDFEVTIDGTNEPVQEGEILEVTATVENVGTAEDTQTIALTDSGFSDQVRDSTSLELDEGDAQTLTFQWETTDGDAGVGDVTVASDDDSDATEVRVQTIYTQAHFAVEILDTNSPVLETADLIVEAEITNEGNAGDTQTVGLTDTGFGNETRDSTELSLAGGESEMVSFAWPTAAGDAGIGEVIVWSEDETDGTDVAVVVEGPSFVVDIVETNEPVNETETLTVEAIVRNIGNDTDTQTIRLNDTGFSDQVRDSTSLELERGTASAPIVFQWTTAHGDAGTETLEVSSANDTASETVTVTAAESEDGTDEDDDTGTDPGDTDPGDDTDPDDSDEADEIDESDETDEVDETDETTGDDRTDADELTVEIAYTPETPEVGTDEVRFNATIEPADAPIADYRWLIDNETASEGEMLKYIFETDGEFDVELVVTTEDGQTARDTVHVDVVSDGSIFYGMGLLGTVSFLLILILLILLASYYAIRRQMIYGEQTAEGEDEG